jgi:PAS domain-containing protein
MTIQHALITEPQARELEVALDAKTQELKSAELKFSAAFDISPIGIWIARPDSTVEFANQVYRHWSGLNDGDNLDNWADMVHPDDQLREWISEIFACGGRRRRCQTDRKIAVQRSASNFISASNRRSSMSSVFLPVKRTLMVRRE